MPTTTAVRRLLILHVDCFFAGHGIDGGNGINATGTKMLPLSQKHCQQWCKLFFGCSVKGQQCHRLIVFEGMWHQWGIITKAMEPECHLCYRNTAINAAICLDVASKEATNGTG